MDFIEVVYKKEYAIVVMQRPKVNAINKQFVTELRSTIAELSVNDSVHGVILTGLPGFFSAGLDIPELYDYDEPTIKQFFIDFVTLHAELAKFRKPLICAITGHSPAGGTVLAIAADYRVMADNPKYSIGLNEVAVNVQISDNLIAAYTFWLGHQRAYKNIIEGNLLQPNDALAAGLVDEVVPLEDVLSKAESKMRHYLLADKNIWLLTKAKLRKAWWDQINQQDPAELTDALKAWWSPEVRQRMQLFIMMLKSK